MVVKVPDRASAAEAVEVEKFLIGKAPEMHADDIRATRKTLELLERLRRARNERGAQATNKHSDSDGLEPLEEKAKAKRAAHLQNHHDGTHTFHWTDTDENLAKLQAALDPLCAPRPADADGLADQRTPAVRRADGMVELIDRLLRGGDLPASHGMRPHLVVTISDTDLRNAEGFGVTATGEKISTAAVRRLACDAVISPLRINGDGIPLNLGRKRRTVSPGQWIALVARDGGCTFPNCDRPAEWCSAHHLRHWTTENGPTDLDNLVLACNAHHDAAHHAGWDARIGEDGHAEWIPPPWVDSEQRPRRNHVWARRRGRGLFDPP